MRPGSDAVAEYTRSAAAHGRATEESRPDGTVRWANRIVKALRRIEAGANGSRAALLPLLDHSNAHVVCWAGTLLLREYSEPASAALERVAKMPRGYAMFGARTVLQEWRAGRLTPTE